MTHLLMTFRDGAAVEDYEEEIRHALINFVLQTLAIYTASTHKPFAVWVYLCFWLSYSQSTFQAYHSNQQSIGLPSRYSRTFQSYSSRATCGCLSDSPSRVAKPQLSLLQFIWRSHEARLVARYPASKQHIRTDPCCQPDCSLRPSLSTRHNAFRRHMMGCKWRQS
jgi:hypothetical protein